MSSKRVPERTAGSYRNSLARRLYSTGNTATTEIPSQYSGFWSAVEPGVLCCRHGALTPAVSSPNKAENSQHLLFSSTSASRGCAGKGIRSLSPSASGARGDSSGRSPSRCWKNCRQQWVRSNGRPRCAGAGTRALGRIYRAGRGRESARGGIALRRIRARYQVVWNGSSVGGRRRWSRQRPQQPKRKGPERQRDQLRLAFRRSTLMLHEWI